MSFFLNQQCRRMSSLPPSYADNDQNTNNAILSVFLCNMTVGNVFVRILVIFL